LSSLLCLSSTFSDQPSLSVLFRSLRAARASHSFPTRRSSDLIHLSHGESEKVSMISNQLKAYDWVFTAGPAARGEDPVVRLELVDRKSTRLNSSHVSISYARFCLKNNTSVNASTPSNGWRLVK